MNYLPDNKMLELEILHLDGFCKKYVNLDDVIPTSYIEFYNQHLTNICINSLADWDKIFKLNS